MGIYAEKIQNDFPYLQEISLEQQLDKYTNSTIILSANLPIKLVKILLTLSNGRNRCMMVTFNVVGNRVTFYCDSINNMYPLLYTLKKYS
jgi:hypothetical protein